VTNESGAGFSTSTYLETENTFDNVGSLTETSGGFLLNQYSNALSYPGHFTNDGTITIGSGAGFFGSSVNVVTNDSGAAITVNSGGVFGGVANYFNSGAINNDGGQLDISAAGDLINQAGGTITSSGLFELDGTLDNSNTVTIKAGGTVTITHAANFHGTINNDTGASIDNFGSVDNSGDVENSGAITDECGAAFTTEPVGTYNGNAVIDGCSGGQSQTDCQSFGGTFSKPSVPNTLWECSGWFNTAGAGQTLANDCLADATAVGSNISFLSPGGSNDPTVANTSTCTI
jgi:hypothetical protein